MVLAAPNLDKKMRMEMNTSDYAIEGVLSIECNNRLWKQWHFYPSH